MANKNGTGGADRSGTRILIVEDEEDQRLRLRYVLESEGYKVDEAVDGVKAIEKLKDGKFDLVITDLKMPGDKNGMDVLMAAKAFAERTEVIIVTAYGTVENAVQAMINGAHDYVQKAVNMPEFRIKVDRALRHAELTRDSGSREMLRNNFNALLRELDLTKERMKNIGNLAQSILDNQNMKLETLLETARSILERSRTS